MIKSSLTDVLNSFNRQELKEFGIFIQSPSYNTNQSVIKLFDELRKFYPCFDQMPDKKSLYEKAFGKIDYNDSFMRMTIFRLMELSKEFLIHTNLNRNSLLKSTILLDELNKRELDKLLFKNAEETAKKIEAMKAKDADAYFARHKVEYYKNDIKSRDTKMINYKDLLDKELMQEQKYMNINFFINSLKFFQYFLNQKSFVINAEGFPDFISEILEYLKHNPEYLTEPELDAYYKLVLLLMTKDEQYFSELSKRLFEDSSRLTANTKHNLVTVLKNYSNMKVQQGKKEYIEKSFQILKYSLEKDIITFSPEGKYMTETRFMNVVWTGVLLMKFEFTENFINKYIDMIQPEKRQYVLAYNLAKLEFERGNFDKALEKIAASGQIKNMMYKAAVKQLYGMIYYEMKWYVQTAEVLDSYRHFIKTDKLLPEIYKSQCSTFINFFNRLLQIINSRENRGFELEKLIEELNSSPHKWLFRKAVELRTGVSIGESN